MVSYETLRAWEQRLESMATQLNEHVAGHINAAPLEHDHAALLHDHTELTEKLQAEIRNGLQTHEDQNHEAES